MKIGQDLYVVTVIKHYKPIIGLQSFILAVRYIHVYLSDHGCVISQKCLITIMNAYTFPSLLVEKRSAKLTYLTTELVVVGVERARLRCIISLQCRHNSWPGTAMWVTASLIMSTTLGYITPEYNNILFSERPGASRGNLGTEFSLVYTFHQPPYGLLSFFSRRPRNRRRATWEKLHGNLKCCVLLLRRSTVRLRGYHIFH